MIETKIIKNPDGKIKQTVPAEDITKAYCPGCYAIMDVDQDGTCMECGTPIAFPAISFEDTKFSKEEFEQVKPAVTKKSTKGK